MQLAPIATDPRSRIVQSIRQWGSCNTDAILDPSCKAFSTNTVEGLIGYRREGKHAVVFGDPVCADTDKPILAKAFQKHCQQQGINVIYAIISKEFAQWATQDLSGVLIEYGKQLILHPQNSPMNNTGTKGSLVRRKVRQAIKNGVTIAEYTGHDVEQEEAIEAVGASWLRNRTGAQIHISRFTLFEDRHGKRWIYARHHDKIVGILMLNELKSQSGWLMNHLMITPEAPNGTSEFLVVKTLELLDREGCHRVICGPIPIKTIGQISGLGTTSSWLVRSAYQIARKIYRLDGLGGFWEKFQPTTEPSYLLFTPGALSIRGVKGLLKAMNATL